MSRASGFRIWEIRLRGLKCFRVKGFRVRVEEIRIWRLEGLGWQIRSLL